MITENMDNNKVPKWKRDELRFEIIMSAIIVSIAFSIIGTIIYKLIQILK